MGLEEEARKAQQHIDAMKEAILNTVMTVSGS